MNYKCKMFNNYADLFKLFLFILNHQIITQYINEPTVRSLRSLKESFYSVPCPLSVIASGSGLKFERIFGKGKSWTDIKFSTILVESEPARCQGGWEPSKINWIIPHWLNLIISITFTSISYKFATTWQEDQKEKI